MKLKSKVNLLCLFLFSLFTSCENDRANIDIEDHVWNLEDSWDLDQTVYDPRAMWVDANEQVIFYDLDENSPVKVFRDNRIIHKLTAGRGPGEVGRRQKFFSENDNKRYLFDDGPNRLMQFDDQFNYLRDITAPFLEKRLYFAGVYSDSLFFASSNEHIIEIASIGKTEFGSEKILYDLRTTDYDFLDPLRNYLLLQTFFFETTDDALYAAMENSSLIFRIDNELNFQYTFEPDSIGIPINEKDGFYALPRIGDQREGLRDLSVHDDYLYAILNGEKYSKYIQLRYQYNFEELIEIIKHGTILIIFNRHTLEYIKSVELPLPSMKIEVTDDKIYLLNSINNDFPFINIYNNNFFME